MIVSKKCVAQTIPTDTTVLKYLYKEAASAYYLRKDTANINKISVLKDSLITAKEAMIANRNEEIKLCKTEKELQGSEIKSLESENKKLTNQKKFYQFTTLLAILTTIIALFK